LALPWQGQSIWIPLAIIGMFQFIICVIGGVMLREIQKTRLEMEIEWKTLPPTITRHSFYLHLRQAVRQAEAQLEQSYVALKRFDDLPLPAEEDESDNEMYLNEYSSMKEIESVIKKLEATLKDVHNTYKQVKTIQAKRLK